MSDQNFAFPIPNEVLEPYIKQAVSSAITAALGDGTELIKKAVDAALAMKVNRHGVRSNSTYENEYPLVETVATKAIQEIAVETIKEMAEQIRPQIKKQVTEYLKGNTSEISRALVDGLIESLQSSWAVQVKIGRGD